MFSANTSQVAADAVNYIEDVFSTYLYAGNNGSQTIVNGVDLATKGGLVWIKNRTQATSHYLQDTANGANNFLRTDKTEPLGTLALNTVFNTNGFSQNNSFLAFNGSGDNYVSWTFRKQPKFFDVVTWVGNNTARTISHNLGSVPGCIIVKNTENASSWTVYHQSLGNTKHLNLNETASEFTSTSWNNTTPTSTEFTLGNLNNVNASGDDFVAYLFAHNAGGFGLTGTDNVISCGSYTGNGSATGPVVTLGYEPQWLLVKNASTANSWFLFDNMRGLTVAGQNDAFLKPNTSDAEVEANYIGLTATGFSPSTSSATVNETDSTYIYIAIRRGPMKVPTVGTSVFSPVAQTNTGSQPFSVTAGFPVDSAWFGQRNGWGVNFITSDRLRGATNLLLTTSTNSEATNNSTYGPSVSKLDSNTQFFDGMTSASEPDIYWMFKRAPSVFDVVCYTGTGSATTFSHNLTMVPELMIVKARTNLSESTQRWRVYSSALGATKNLILDLDQAVTTSSSYWNNTAPTSTVFTVGTNSNVNWSGDTYVNYLFATCAGVSKVGSYTGNGTTQTIDCGFTGGARFVLIKRTDATGDWYTYDTARGMTVLTDPYLLMNSTAAEVATLGSVTTVSTGFAVNASILAAINTNAASYIFLAIA